MEKNYRLPKVGEKVNVIEKRNYESGKLTTGTVRRILGSPREVHPRGNKVELDTGTVGRMVSFVDEVGVQNFVDPAERERYAAEVRALRPAGKFTPNFRRNINGSRNFGERRSRNEVAEPPVNLADLPGEDDLR